MDTELFGEVIKVYGMNYEGDLILLEDIMMAQCRLSDFNKHTKEYRYLFAVCDNALRGEIYRYTPDAGWHYYASTQGYV